MSNATLNIRINDELTFTSQADYKAMTRQGNAVKGREMRDIIEHHYGLGILGRFNHEVIEGVQDSATEGRCIVKASVGSKSNALYFILGYDSTDSIEYRGGSVLASFTNLEDAQKELHATTETAETTNNEDNMNNLTPTRTENAIQLITGLTEENDHSNAVVILAIVFGTKAQHMETRRIAELHNEAKEMSRELLTRRELVKTQILLSIAEKDLDLYRRVKECF